MNKNLPKPKWNKRDYGFETLAVGGEIFQFESLNYFRTAASKYFSDRPKKHYMTEQVIQLDVPVKLADGTSQKYSRNMNAKGIKGLLLTRLEDTP